MGISKDGWLDWAIHRPGPAWKTNGGSNGLLGLAFHSAEGYENGLWSVLDGIRKASWHFSNLKDGRMFQHYPIQAQTWTSGAGYPNNNMPGIETEGVVGQPLTEAQIANVVRLIKEISAFTGRRPERIGNRTSVPVGVLALIEHGEATRWGALPTSCPSGRYPWPRIFDLLKPSPAPIEPDEEGDGMYVVHKHNTEHPDRYKAYLVQGKVWRHIPDLETFEALKAVGLPIYWPNAKAYEMMIQGATLEG